MTSLLRDSAAHVFVADLVSPVLDDDDRHHLLKVLRVAAHEVVSVSDGRGSWCTATISRDGDLRVTSEVSTSAAPQQTLTVAFAPTKNDKPDDVVRKLTEIGINRIALIAESDHAVVRWVGDKADKHSQRLLRIAREAAMQSRRLWVPEVTLPMPLAVIVAEYCAALGEPSGEPINSAHTCIAIGPEGGFSAAELATTTDHVSLGDGVMRGETAAIVAGALLAARRLVGKFADNA